MVNRMSEFPENLASVLFGAAERTSDKLALIDACAEPELRVTYGELAGHVSHLAAALDKLGFKRGDHVGLLLYNQPAFVIGYFALLALGITVIPLNTRLTATEISTILNDAEARWLFSSGEFFEVLADLNVASLRGVVLSGTEACTDKDPISQPVYLMSELIGQKFPYFGTLPKPVTEERVATLIYTSGTTGKPKGVMLSHGNILADARANVQVIEAVSDDVFVTVSPLFHVFGQTNVLISAMMVGATVVLVKKFSPRSILEAIERYGVTFLAAVPTMYQMMLSQLRERTFDLSSIRVCHSGAAPMPVEVFGQVEAAFGAPVQEGYGLSEASSIITSNPMHGPRKPGSVGLPLPGIIVRVLNEDFQPTPPGEVGEIHVQGDTVMLGYYQRPEETAATLVNGWLKTKDLAFMDEDGYIHIVDRKDDLINVGGVKVYPREIEEVLYRHPAVQSVAVVGTPTFLHYQNIKAFVVLKPGVICSREELQGFCQPYLAEYKIPKSVEFVTEIPQGATGKILRKVLRDAEPVSAPNGS